MKAKGGRGLGGCQWREVAALNTAAIEERSMLLVRSGGREGRYVAGNVEHGTSKEIESNDGRGTHFWSRRIANN